MARIFSHSRYDALRDPATPPAFEVWIRNGLRANKIAPAAFGTVSGDHEARAGLQATEWCIFGGTAGGKNRGSGDEAGVSLSLP